MAKADNRSDRSGCNGCSHHDRRSTTHAGLRRLVCEICKRVNLDFVDCADTGILFRIPRLA